MLTCTLYGIHLNHKTKNAATPFYLSDNESELLKSYSLKNDITISELVWYLIKQVLKT